MAGRPAAGFYKPWQGQGGPRVGRDYGVGPGLRRRLVSLQMGPGCSLGRSGVDWLNDSDGVRY